jgi:hypothetical protein
MQKAHPVESRSHKAVLSWQLGSISQALRMTIPNGLSPGNATIALLTAARKQMEATGENGLGLTGVAIDNIPHVNEQSNPVDVLVVSEALFGLMQCLLEPDERDEQNNYFGFRPPK